ncbi:amphiphysin [Genypterus blacodes]|uniref:amphiphysin n=1 Tax=Genypterus blacodes TaxID=154954 RepID=UPI003F7586E4
MADMKTGIFAKNVQKRLNRAQEKVLQKLGKADETKDEQFEQVVINFKRQESEGSRLQREMKAYMAAIKGMQQASINLSQSLHEVYEPDWHGKDDVMTIGKDCDALWEDFNNKLVDSTLLSLDEYLQHFPDLKNRVAKRSRKLIDYDSARHHVETLQASGMKNDRKMMKAEDELKKAQKVFDELDVGLQDELPTLWDSRVCFYIGTFKSVTSLESRFHRDISTLCKQLYEVMMNLGEQHSDKMFTIQGAPSDSGPLRLARTPSPPDDESPPESPDLSSNHMLRPISPGPPRPKSPSQLKKGPPVPPPPKATPTKEVAEEQIIDLFGGEFFPAPSPSQPNERPGESLLDLDFDAFQPDESVSPIPQTAVPWDMWSANSQPAQPQADVGFVADWSADFGSMTETVSGGDGAPEVEVSDGSGQDRPSADSHQPVGDVAMPPPQIQDSEAVAEHQVSNLDPKCSTSPTTMGCAEVKQQEVEVEREDLEPEQRKSTPGLLFTNEYGDQIEDSTENRGDRWSRSPDGSGSEYETAEEWGDGGQGGGWVISDDEREETVTGPGATPWGPFSSEGGSEGTRSGIEDFVGNLSVSVPPGQSENNANPTPQGNPSGFINDISGGRRETQGLEKSRSGPFVEAQEAGLASESDPFAETREAGWFKSDHLSEKQAGGGFESDPFGEGGVGVEFDPFPESSAEGSVVGFTTDPFTQTVGEDQTQWDPFAERLAAFSAGSWQEVTDSSGFFSSIGHGDSASPFGITTERIPRIHRELENSDMSEDEAANRRFGTLYQELDTEKEEVLHLVSSL